MISSHQMQPMLSISATEESVYTSSWKELHRCTLSQISCMVQILRAQRQKTSTREKYEAIATANNLKFYPIIFENTGGIISQSYEYLQDLLKVFSGGYQGSALLRQYWKNRISCAYFHSVASEIETKIKYLTGVRYVDQRYENRASFIQESSSIDYHC